MLIYVQSGTPYKLFWDLLSGKVSTKLYFKQGWTCKKYTNKTEMKTCKKTALLCNNGRKKTRRLLYIYCMCSRCRVVLCIFHHRSLVEQSFCMFHLCLVSVLFTCPSLLEIKFCGNFPDSKSRRACKVCTLYINQH